jgi:FkbM family methyltransferase
MREHVIRRGSAAGLRTNLHGSRPSYVLGLAEPDTQRLLGTWLRPGSVFYDLGANVGFFTLIASQLVGSEGHVYALEPSATTASALSSNVARNDLRNVTVIEAAAGGADGSARLDPAGAVSQDARLIGEHEPGGVPVRLVTIDALVRDGARPPDVVKIDVEGAEEDAIVGMRATLLTHRPSVVCEIHRTVHTTEHPVAVTLREAGYAVAWLEARMTSDAEWWAPHLVAVPLAR